MGLTGFMNINDALNYNFSRPEGTPSRIWELFGKFYEENADIMTQEQRKNASLFVLSDKAIGDGVERPGYNELMQVFELENEKIDTTQIETGRSM